MDFARRQINADELSVFYTRIGAAIWHIQYLEDVLVQFLTIKIIHQKRRSGKSPTPEESKAILAKKRKLNIGPLIKACVAREIIPSEYQARFEAFKEERHWLVHRSMVNNGNDLYLDATRNAIFSRISAIEEEADFFKQLIFEKLEKWVSERGVNLESAYNTAEKAIKNLKGE